MQSLFKLLSKWMYGSLSTDELANMRQMVHNDSEELRSSLETLWQDESAMQPMPMESKARILSQIQRSTAIKHRNFGLKIACAVFLPLFLTWGFYFAYNNLMQNKQQNLMVTTDRGQKVHLTLPDGSAVWLNSQSSLSYPTDFGRKNRIVQLIGEGYFEIAKDPDHPFRVATDNINVVVHGTKFNVCSHQYNHTIQVSLIEGSVSIEDNNCHLLTSMTPNHTVSINKKDLSFQTISEQTDKVALWHLNKCHFENADAHEVFKKLSYWYGLNIKLININTKYRYGFTVRNETMRELLDLINRLTPVEYSINGEEVIIRYK